MEYDVIVVWGEVLERMRLLLQINFADPWAVA